jgi:nitrous oxidase accessory protein
MTALHHRLRIFLTGAMLNAVIAFSLHAEIVEVAPGAGALAAAIEEAKPGDVLRLAPGAHSGPVVIEKPLTLTSDGGASILGDSRGSVVTVDAPDVVISFLTIKGSGSSHNTIDAGVTLTQRAERAVIENNILIGNLVGVDIHGAAGARVAGNRIEGRLDRRMNDRGNGIYLWNAPGSIVEGNEIAGGRDGIFISTSSRNVLRDNRMSNLRFAIHYMYSNDSEVSGNISHGNHLGFALMFSSGLIVRRNESSSDRDHGIMLNFVNDSRIEGNVVRDGRDKCLFMYNANKNTLYGNRFENCRIGIHFTAGSERNHVWGNAFIGNRTQVKYVGTTDHDWSRNGVGNYWSDHAAFDINGDGVADQSYRPNDMIDKVLWTQPSAGLLLGSPAVQLVRWAQSSFPSLLPGGVVDSAPLMKPLDIGAKSEVAHGASKADY